jgi:hypothetical protein
MSDEKPEIVDAEIVDEDQPPEEPAPAARSVGKDLGGPPAR